MPAGGNPRIDVQISALDQYSATFAKLRKDLNDTAKLTESTGRRMAKVEPPAFNLGNARRRFAEFDREVSGHISSRVRLAASGRIPGLGVVGSVSGVIPGFGALAGVGAVAGIGELTERYSRAGVSLENTSRLAGTTAQGMDSLRGAARLLGLDAGVADQTMVGLNKTIADAYYGKDAQAVAMFQQLKIGLQGVGGGAAKAEAVLPRIADSIRELAKSDPRAAVTALSALHIPADFLPVLMRGADGVAGLRKEVGDLYGGYDKYIASSDRFTYSMGRLGIVADRVGMSVMTSLEPHLTPLLTRLGDFVDRHQGDIGETFDHLGRAIEGIDWGKVGQGVEGVGRFFSAAATKVDDFGTRVNRVLDTLGEIKRIVQLPGLEFRKALQGGSMEIDPSTGMWRPSQGYGSPTWAGITAGRPGSYDYATPRERGNKVPPVGAPTFDTNLTPQVRGLLDTIAGTESPGYDVMYGGRRFTDFSHHPGVANPITSGPNAGQTSSAAGRYQFLQSTWNEAAAALGLTDFSPASQDKAAWWLAQRQYRNNTGRSLTEDLQSTSPGVRSGIGQALRGTWTSLPGGIEATTNTNRFLNQLDANTRREGALNGVPPLGPRFGPPPEPPPQTPDLSRGGRLPAITPPVPVPQQSNEPDLSRGGRLPGLMPPPSFNGAGGQPAQTADNSGGSTVRIDINHNNIPAGVDMNVSTQGSAAEMGTIRTRRAMPDAGYAPAFGGT